MTGRMVCEAPSWSLELACKPDFERAMQRIDAWWRGEVIDRAPVRFSAHNAFVSEKHGRGSWPTVMDKWFDAEFQVGVYLESIEGRILHGETFPVFWPNVGPNYYASLYGCELRFDEVTSWALPCIHVWDDLSQLKLDLSCVYHRRIEELTRFALRECPGKFMVGYTDLHPGLDCVAAWRGTQALLLDLYMRPDEVQAAMTVATRDFQAVYDGFDRLLKAHRQPSVTWMGIPSFGKMHVPSCDFSAMISPEHFEEFCLPALQREVKGTDHNVFHVDGKGVARHLDAILEIPEIQALQWVQGLNDDQPIMQWVPLIRRIQQAGRSVVVELELSELEAFMAEVPREGILLCIGADEADQEAILARVARWR
jgi:hypothetical protein